MNNLKSVFASLVILFCFTHLLSAQTIVTNPIYPVDKDSCTVIYDASKGNAELMNEEPPIYAHTGVITNLSRSNIDFGRIYLTARMT